jgi:hypothetical protein
MKVIYDLDSYNLRPANLAEGLPGALIADPG